MVIFGFLSLMVIRSSDEKPSRGHKKRERTRRQLVAAGLEVLAEKGDALTVSDVVAAAEVSNGTFYNYFADRDELIDAVAEHSLLSLAAQSAMQTAEADPAVRFATATSMALGRAMSDPTWGRTILRLSDHRRSSPGEMRRYLREDLATGFDQGRFVFGPDDVTLDFVTGLLLMTIRRIVRGEAGPGHVERVLARALRVLGIDEAEATSLVEHVFADRGRPTSS